jgi:hypothetical protein
LANHRTGGTLPTDGTFATGAEKPGLTIWVEVAELDLSFWRYRLLGIRCNWLWSCRLLHLDSARSQNLAIGESCLDLLQDGTGIGMVWMQI